MKMDLCHPNHGYTWTMKSSPHVERSRYRCIFKVTSMLHFERWISKTHNEERGELPESKDSNQPKNNASLACTVKRDYPSISMDSTHQIQGILLRAGNYIHGRDSDDPSLTYSSIMEWKESVGLTSSSVVSNTDNLESGIKQRRYDTSRQKWYKTGFDYWEDESSCPATVDGVLGGFSCLSKKDLDGSMEFMRFLKTNLRPELKFTEEDNDNIPTRACECGAGIGRVSKGLLLPLGITQCDLVEPSPRLLSSAPEYIGKNSSKCRFFSTGLQDFEPTEHSYDIIWIQWVIGYLTDDDLISFLKRCSLALRSGGVIVIKDNTCEEEAFTVDREDASCTRSYPYILAIAELAGLRVVYQLFQQDFPAGIFPVPMIAFERKILHL